MHKQPRSVEAMVEHQARKWALEHSKKHSRGQRWPVITVSRQYGSRGAALARSTADTLGFRCWDQELVHAIAENAHAPERLFASLDEHLRPAVAQIVDSFDFDAGVSEIDYLRQLTRTVQQIANRGRAVIVGRGAHYILAPDAALRIRIVAPLDHRIASVANRQGVSKRAARAEIEREERARRDFMRHHYDRDIDDPTQYDLLLNSACYPAERAKQVIIEAYRALVGRVPDEALHD